MLALPEGLGHALQAIRQAGGRPLVVGGAVRDALLGLPLKDFDVEVYGLASEALLVVLERLGSVDPVGRAFAVFKVSGLEGIAGAVDVSLPRRDSKAGSGHKGIAVAGDPSLSVEDAARRRDFTINAIAFDPVSSEVLDPVGGRVDLEQRVLRAVDTATFGEDPLRALRAVQFAARFELCEEPETARLCAAMPLSELPRERVFGEIEKLLLRAKRPALGFALMHDWGMLPALAPELLPLETTPQDAEWHPEGDVWTHTLMVLDEAAKLIADLDPPRALTLMLASLCHDLGKPGTTAFEDGRIRSKGHEEAGVAPTHALLDRWNVHSLHGYEVRAQVVALVADHLKPGQLYHDRDRVSDGAIRRLSRRCEARLLERVARADCLGRGGGFAPVAMDWFSERIRSLDVGERPPAPLLKGRDVVALGVAPGPAVGRILNAVYERQLDGEIATWDAALVAARDLLES